MTTPIYQNTGGGVFGAIRTRVREDANLRDPFGDRIKPGRMPRQTEFPFLIMSHVSGIIDDIFVDVPREGQLGQGDRYDVWRESIQVSVYADNYEAARQLGKLFHARISRQTICADYIPVTLFPDSRILQLDPQPADKSADVWHYDFRYHFWTADKLLPDQTP